MAFIIKVITDAISKDILIAPNPKPSHFPTKKLINNTHENKNRWYSIL